MMFYALAALMGAAAVWFARVFTGPPPPPKPIERIIKLPDDLEPGDYFFHFEADLQSAQLRVDVYKADRLTGQLGFYHRSRMGDGPIATYVAPFK